MTNENKQQQYTVSRTKRCSRIRASGPRCSNEYYNALINTALYNPKLSSKESNDSRYHNRLSVAHSETISQSVRSQAIEDLRLHGQSLTNRWVSTTIETFQQAHCYIYNSQNNICNCPTDWLICLCQNVYLLKKRQRHQYPHYQKNHYLHQRPFSTEKSGLSLQDNTTMPYGFGT